MQRLISVTIAALALTASPAALQSARAQSSRETAPLRETAPARETAQSRDAVRETGSIDRARPRAAQSGPSAQPLFPDRNEGSPPAAAPAGPNPAGQATSTQPKDPREGDAAYEQAQRLMRAIDAVLQDTARQRGEARKLPSNDDFLLKPIWTESKEDRQKKIDPRLGMATAILLAAIEGRQG